MPESENHLVRIFKDAAAHQKVAGIISRHLTSQMDIREVALDGLDLSKTRNILDMGCGFGFFTEGLKGKIHKGSRITGIDCHPEYEWFFFQSCEKVDPLIQKRFISNGVKELGKLEQGSFDLVLCSYGLYFFPDVIREIPRVMKRDGMFIIITHASPHLHPFTGYIREILLKNGFVLEDDTPYELLIRQFSDRNGRELLTSYFQTISEKKFHSDLVFGPGDIDDFTAYFDFKRSFFIPHQMDEDDRLHHLALKTVNDFLDQGNQLTINKDDVIYVCSDPFEL